MGSTLLGGPTVTNIKPPAPLFPGMTQTYTGALQGSGILPASLGTLTQAAQTGLPTDVGPAFEAMKAAMARSTAEGRTALRESYGARGLSGGTDLFKAGTDFEAQNQANLNNILAQYTKQAQEAAAGRRMAAAGTGLQAFGEPALAFAPTQVAGRTSGILGPLLQAGASSGMLGKLADMFKNFFQGSAPTIQTPQVPSPSYGTSIPPDLNIGYTPTTQSGYPYNTVPIDPTGSSTVNLDYGPALSDMGDPGAGGTYGGYGGGGYTSDLPDWMSAMV